MQDDIYEINKLVEDKSIIKDLWREVAELIAPHLMDMDGTYEDKFLHAPGHYSGNAKMYLEVMARGMFSQMVGEGADFMEVGAFGDESVEKDPASQQFFERLRIDIVDGMYRDGWYDHIKSQVEYVGALGTDVLTITGDYLGGRIDFIHWHPGDFYIGEDAGGRVDRLALKIRTTGHDLKEILGYLPPNLKNTVNTPKPSKRKLQLWAYFRRLRADEDSMDREMKWVYKLMDRSGNVLSESPMRGLPGPVWRLERIARTPYGLGYGVKLFRDMLQSNKIQKLLMKEAELRVNPPLWIPTSDRDLFLDPGSQNYVEQMNPGNFPRRMIDPADLAPAMELKGEIERLARIHLLTDFFLPLTDKTNRKTQAEVQGLMMETSAQLAVLVDSMERNCLNTAIRRYATIRWEHGTLPEPPRKVKQYIKEGGFYKLRFIGPLAKSRRYMFSVGQDMKMIENILAPLGSIPSDHPVMDALDVQAMLERAKQYMSGGRSVVKSSEQIAAERAEREMKMLMMQQQQMAQKAIGQTQAAEPGSPAQAVMNG